MNKNSKNSFLESTKKLGKIIQESQQDIYKNGKSILKSLDRDSRNKIVYFLFSHIYRCNRDNNGVSYRTILYDCLIFNQSSYMVMQLANMLELNNALIDKYDKINIDIDENLYKDGEKLFFNIEHNDRLDMTAYIIYIFTTNETDKFFKILDIENSGLEFLYDIRNVYLKEVKQ